MAQRIIISQNVTTDDDATLSQDVASLTRASAGADTLTLAVVGSDGATVTLDNDTARDLALAILAWVGKAPRAVAPKDAGEDVHATAEAMYRVTMSHTPAQVAYDATFPTAGEAWHALAVDVAMSDDGMPDDAREGLTVRLLAQHSPGTVDGGIGFGTFTVAHATAETIDAGEADKDK